VPQRINARGQMMLRKGGGSNKETGKETAPQEESGSIYIG